MKTKTRYSRIEKTAERLYTIHGLKRYRPEGFKRAHEKYQEDLTLDWASDEMMASLKGLCKAAGVRVVDWNLGAYNRSNKLRVEMPGDDATANLSGPRALAWIENNILGPLRQPWGLRPVKTFDVKLSHGTHNTRYNVEDGKPKRRWDAPGTVPECPFTGVCYDMDFLEALIKDVKSGTNLKDAFQGLESDFARILEAEYDYQQEEAQFIETADANGYEYTADGRQA